MEQDPSNLTFAVTSVLWGWILTLGFLAVGYLGARMVDRWWPPASQATQLGKRHAGSARSLL